MNLTGLGELPHPGYLPVGGYAGLSLATPPIQAGGSEEHPSFDQARYYLQSMRQKSYNRGEGSNSRAPVGNRSLRHGVFQRFPSDFMSQRMNSKPDSGSSPLGTGWVFPGWV